MILRAPAYACVAVLSATLAVGGAAAAAPALRSVRLAGEGGNVQVALAASGDAVAAWSSDPIVWSSFRTRGRRWGTPVAIASATFRVLDIDGGGNAVLVWASLGDSNGSKVFVAERPRAGARWTGPHALSSEQRALHSPSLDVNERGDAIVTFWDGVLRSSYRRRGGTWEQSQTVASPATDGVVARVQLDSSGSAVATWLRAHAGGGIYVSRRPVATGDWTEPLLLAPLPVGSDPDLAVNAAGDALVAWVDPGVVGTGRAARVSSWSAKEGTWSPPETIGGGGYLGVAPALDDAGTALLAAFARPGLPSSFIRLFERRPGRDWSSIATIESPSQPGSVSVDANGNGTAALSWVVTGRLRVMLRSSDGRWRGPDDVGVASEADIAVTATGDVVAAHASYAGTAPQTGVFAGVVDATAPRIARAAVATHVRVGQRVRFSVAAIDDWSALRKPDWRFGDGTRAAGSRAWHVYRRAGMYRVRLTVTDAAGNLATRRWTIRVTA